MGVEPLGRAVQYILIHAFISIFPRVILIFALRTAKDSIWSVGDKSL